MKYTKSIKLVFLSHLFLFVVTSLEAVAMTKKDNELYSEIDIFSTNSEHSLICKKDRDFARCINPEYEKHIGPWRYRHLTNLTLPWYIHYYFTIFDVLEVDDQKQTISLDMYMKIKWLEPRLSINTSSGIWNERAIKLDGEDYVSIPLEDMKHFWIPDLEIAWLELYRTQNVLRETASFRTSENKLLRYIARVKVTISCQMNFEHYPFDSQLCRFRQGSFHSPQEIVDCTSKVTHRVKEQRELQYDITITDPHPEDHTFEVSERVWAVCGFRIELKRQRTKIFLDVYLTSTLLVIASWVSFIVDPDAIPGRMGRLVTIFLVLINIFIGVKRDSPKSSGFLNAMDVFLVVCIGEVFTAFLEYALVLYWFGQRLECNVPLKYLNLDNISVEHKNKTTLDPTENGWINESKLPTIKKRNRNCLDQISLFLYPIAFLIFICVYMSVYLT